MRPSRAICGLEAGSASKAADGRITWPGMTREGTVLLPNGWSLKPAGRQEKLGDLPVQIAPHPRRPILAILHAGYGEHEVVTVDGNGGREGGRVIGRVAIPGTFAGMTWSADGKQLFVGGGFDDLIYRFDHADGLLSNKAVFEYLDRKAFLAARNPREDEAAKKHQRTPAGLAVTKPERQDALRFRVVPAIRSGGSTHSRRSSWARSRWVPAAILTAWHSTSRAGGSTSASGARPRSPSSISPPSRSSRPGRRRSIPTRCCWRRGGRSSTWPTPTATRSR